MTNNTINIYHEASYMCYKIAKGPGEPGPFTFRTVSRTGGPGPGVNDYRNSALTLPNDDTSVATTEPRSVKAKLQNSVVMALPAGWFIMALYCM